MGITFKRRFQESIKKRGEHSPAGLWLNTIIVGALIFLAGAIYTTIRRGPFTIDTANGALAFAGLVVTGLSMILAPICYFWNFADTKIIYRKHLGWVGFGFIALHIIASVFFLEAGTFPDDYSEHLVSFLLGGASFVVFVLIAAVSNRYGAHELGGVHWRRVLRLVYPAYILAVLHFTWRSAPFWLRWFRNPTTPLPSLSLLALVFSLVVIGFRIALWVALRRKQRKTRAAAVQPTTTALSIAPAQSKALAKR